MRRLRSLIIAGSAVTTVLVALGLAATAATASTGPRIAREGGAAAPAAGGRNDFFNGSACTSSTFCMAVGAFSLNGHNRGLAEMLSGGNWLAETVPSPTRGVNVFANEVSCASPASCLLVGDHYARQRGPAKNLAEAWNGSSWRIVSARGPGGTAFSGLQDVACPIARFCLAVGFAGTGRHYQDTAYTWKNGTSWARIRVPRPSHARQSELAGLACVSARNCMAAGNYTSAAGRNLPFAARWHDGRWKLLAMPAVRRQRVTVLQGVSCPTAARCVAVGDTEDNTSHRFFHAFAEVWSGGKWRVSTLRRSPSGFFGTSCPALDRCFASGDTFPSPTTFARPLIESWNGRTWATGHPVQTSAPNSGDVLVHVSCVTRADCEAVGFSFVPGVSKSDRTLAEFWNGHRWTVQPTVSP
jgi:hypothetical protein